MKLLQNLALTTLCSVLLMAPAILPAQSTKNPDQIIKANTFVKIAESSLPSVISIDVRVLPNQEFLDKHGADSLEDLRDQLFGGRSFSWPDFDPDRFGSLGSGSGVVMKIDSEYAYAVTNRHVLESGRNVEYTVVLDSSFSDIPVEVKTPDVEVMGMDELTDLAVIKFRLPDDVELQALDFADSDEVMIGEFVLALGSPLDLNNSVSHGIISAKDRNISRGNRIEDLLQTTAVINPGNSGGPLVNLDGDIVGINNAIATTTGRWAGVGFAIPSNQARRVSEMLIENGEVSRGYLGIRMEDSEDLTGVEILSVSDDTPAEIAGLKRGDIVTHVDGRRVADTRGLLSEIGNRLAGDSVELEVTRGSEGSRESSKFEVVLAQRPPEQSLQTMRPFFTEEETSEPLIERMGFEVEVDEEENGLLVTDIRKRSNAYKAGLRKGDIIIQINGIQSESLERMESGFDRILPGKEHTILFYRDGESRFVNFEN